MVLETGLNGFLEAPEKLDVQPSESTDDAHAAHAVALCNVGLREISRNMRIHTGKKSSRSGIWRSKVIFIILFEI